MSPLIVVVALGAILAVAAVGLSLFAAWRSQAQVLMVENRATAGLQECQETVESLRKTVLELQADLRELHHEGPATISAAPRSSLNLSKRSQVLRLHRKGEAAEQIAPALDLPLQEVRLLIKVHGVVLESV